MIITCIKCGSDKFHAGELEMDFDGGYTIVMPCAQCGTPNKSVHSDDSELAQMLSEFFRSAKESKKGSSDDPSPRPS